MDSFDEIVISGISGRFPQSNSIYEFRDNLFSGIDMVTEDDRWPKDVFNITNRIAKLNHYSEFDAEFFEISDQEADLIDPQIRMLLEVVFECIYDAGMNLSSIKGPRTGIFMASFFNEIDRNLTIQHSEYIGYKQIFLGRLCHAFDVRGPSYFYETACSSASTCIAEAFSAIRHKQVDQAIIASCNISLSPTFASLFQKLGLVSKEGKCRHLDEKASGYVKSDAITAFLLQKSRAAKRIYATIVNAKTNADGFKEEGITFPKWETQRDLIEATYEEVGIDPLDVDYVEAHGTGTRVGDAQEMLAISRAFKVNERKAPLLIGSVKSNVGHSEGSSGLTSILKVIFAFEKRCIPKNLHFSSPNHSIEELLNETVVPVTENTSFDGKIVGINNFGFGGSNAHIILKRNEKEIDQSCLKIVGKNFSRLVLFCGRNEEAVNYAFETMEMLVKQRRLTNEFLSLVNNYAKNEKTKFMKSRGFLILNEHETKKKSIRSFCERRPFYIVFGGLGQQFKAMGAPFMKFAQFSESVQKSAKILQPMGIDLIDLLTNEHCSIDVDNSIISLIPISAFQLALIDLILDLGLKPDGYLGHSFGELACGYIDGALTREQCILASYIIFECTKGLSNGMMVATDLSVEEFEQSRIPNVCIACDNSKKSITVAGNKEAVSRFVEKLNSENRFVKVVKTNGISFHCPEVDLFFDKIREKFLKLMPQMHARSSKWISTSIQECNWQQATNEIVGEYFSRLIRATVTFRDAVRHIPKNAVIFEVSSRKFLTSILNHSLADKCTKLFITNGPSMNEQSVVDSALANFGTLYELGFDVNIEKLYTSVEYPFPNDVDSFSPLIKLDHSKPKLVRKYPNFFSTSNTNATCRIDVNDNKWNYLIDHNIDGKVLFPAAGYLCLIWDHFVKKDGKNQSETIIAFENVTFHRAVIISKETKTSLKIEVINEEGKYKFIIAENNKKVVSGLVFFTEKENDEVDFDNTTDNETSALCLTSDDVYKEFEIRGYRYGDNFKLISEAKSDGSGARIRWTNNFVTFLDNMFQLHIVSNQNRSLRVPTRVNNIILNPKKFRSDQDIIAVYIDRYTEECFTQGIMIHGLKFVEIRRNSDLQEISIEKYVFVPYKENEERNVDYDLDLEPSIQIVAENVSGSLIKVTEINFHCEPFENLIFDILISNNHTSFNYYQLYFNESENTSKKYEYKSFLITEEFKFPSEVNASDVFIMKVKSKDLSKLCFESILMSLNENGFILFAIEQRMIESEIGELSKVLKMIVVYEKTYSNATIILFKKQRVEFEACENYSLSLKTIGDLSSFRWTQSVSSSQKNSPNLCIVHYSAFNFKDLMLSTGKLGLESIPKADLREIPIGMEFSGVDSKGNKIMGFVRSDVIAYHVVADPDFTWMVPDEWSLAEAATVPVAYCTAYYSLFIRGKLKRGESVLIHSGSGGVGMAAIALCLQMDCEVFTTVGNHKKREALLNLFPKLKASNIFNSRETSFEDNVMRATNGRGVDVVINSLSKEMLQASSRCLAVYGRYLEIGKYDLFNNSSLGLQIFLKNIEFHGIMLDSINVRNDGSLINNQKRTLHQLVSDGIKSGVVAPLPKTIFSKNKIEDAFRFMSKGTHIGKILIDMKSDQMIQVQKKSLFAPCDF